MLRGGRRVVQETQRDPARGEFLLGLVDVAGGQCRVAGDQIGVAVFAGVEQFSRQQPPFDPPFVQIVQPAGILRRAQHQLRGLGELVFAAQQLNLAEDVAGVAMQFAGHRVQQRLGVGGLLVRGDAGLRQRHLIGAEPLGGAQRGLILAAVEQEIHPRLVIARRDQRAEQIERRALGILRDRIGSPRAAHQTLGIGAVAARDHRARQRELALGRARRFVFEPRPDRGVVATVVPQRRLDAPAQEGLRGPAWIGREERAIALDRRAVVVAAQDDPFREFLRDRIRYRGLRLRRIRRLALAHQLDDVFQRLGIGLRGRRRRGDCGRRRRLAWRRRQSRGLAGRRAPGLASAGAAVAIGAVFWAAVLAAGAVFLAAVVGTRLRAIGRGFGNGTLVLATASTVKADNPTASARLVANAVDRNAAARAGRVTAFPNGESFNR